MSRIPGCGVLPRQEPSKAAPKPPRAKAGRFAVLNAFVDVSMRGLSGSAVKVWLIVFRDTKPSGVARVSDADMARRGGMNQRTVRRARAELRRAGLLVVIRQGGFRTGPSTYRARPLAEGVGVRPMADKSGHGLRASVPYIPERDQKGVVTLKGPTPAEKKSHQPTGRCSASPPRPGILDIPPSPGGMPSPSSTAENPEGR